MSKVLTSPVKRWPGTITIPDFLTIDQAIKWEEAVKRADSILPECEPFKKGEKLTDKQVDNISAKTSAKWVGMILPGILACVESWNIGIDPNNFPATPPISRIKLISWIMSEISKLYEEENEIPNA